jgi:hypothetical protein
MSWSERGRWDPEVGQQTEWFNKRLAARIPDADERKRVIDTAREVLSFGPSDSVEEQEHLGRTGVALGYVQSGKTTSFTALSALAADNGYDVIVAMLGRTNLLVNLNKRDMRANLGIEEKSWTPTWSHLAQPFDDQAGEAAGQAIVAGRKILLTLMKHPKHIAAAAQILKRIGPRRTLIIDDEADQASLNTRARGGKRTGKQSRIYKEILGLRAAAGPYLYVQYTATPFAPLLLEPTDQLSPEFLVQLAPGGDYVGGRTFFVERSADLVRPIAAAEARLETLTSLPEGLKKALGSFFVAAAMIRSSQVKMPPVSMLVHPSHLRVVHSSYFGVINAVIDDWVARLRRPEGDEGRDEDLRFFRACHEDFARSMKSFDELIPDLVQVIKDARRWLVNSDGQALDVDWHQGNVHILVGGSILDRGFVVDGLVTTYLTRGDSGAGQADTIEQRARCFGYKRGYIDYCRVFTPDPVASTFRSLVHTEDSMRASLLDHLESGRPLSTWAEDVGLELPANVAPTRANVTRALERSNVAGEFHAMRVPSLDADDIRENFAVVEDLGWDRASRLQFGKAKHEVLSAVSPEDVVGLLESWRPGDDALPWAGARFAEYLRRRYEAGALDDFVVVRLGHPQGGPRQRRWNSAETGMAALLQGADVASGYPGDRGLFPGRPQLQVHRVEPTGAVTGIAEVLALALYVPKVQGYPDHLVVAAT